MKIADVMTTLVVTIGPQQSITEAAALMRDKDIGCLPVHENDRLIGMITDRDIVLGAVAEGHLDKSVSDVMSREINYCHTDDSVKAVARNMADLEMRRLPVVDGAKRLVGIVSLANIAHASGTTAKTVAQGVAKPH